MSAAPLGILLISGGDERAHYAFVVATAAAALGRPVVLFATNEGCRALLADRLPAPEPDRHGVAGLAELRAAAAELGVRLCACEAGLRIAGLAPEALRADVQVAGITTFLGAIAGGQIVTL